MHTVPITTDLLRGVAELEPGPRGLRPHRLPAAARAVSTDPQLAMAEAQPAGVRLAFRTTARRVELDVVPTKRVYAGLPARPDGVHELVVDGEVAASATAPGGDVIAIDMATGGVERTEGDAVTLAWDLPDGDHVVEHWLPHDEETLLVALRADAPLEPLPARPVWLHHGSSISHGSNAATPTGTWPVVAARATGVDLVSLGLGGSALLQPLIAETLRDTPADVVSLELGINLVNQGVVRRSELAGLTHAFLDTVRAGHPEAPLLVITPIHCAIHETTPGPTAFDPASFATGSPLFVATGDAGDPDALTLTGVREVLAEVVAERDDERMTLVDGLSLHSADDAAIDPLPDALHPGPTTHRRMGERFAQVLAEASIALTR